MLAIFVLSLSSIVGANGIQGNWSNAAQQMNAGEEQPPNQSNPNLINPNLINAIRVNTLGT